MTDNGVAEVSTAAATVLPRPAAVPGGCQSAPLWLLGLSVLYLVQSLPRLSAVPRAIMDESWESCTGYALAFEGRLRNPVVQNRFSIDRAFVQPRVTQSLLLAGVYRVQGFSLTSGRVASVLVGLVAVWGVFYLMRTWLSVAAAGLITLLFAIETQFFILSRTIRPEVYLLCASVWMLALLARGTVQVRPRRCVAAGIVGAVGCYTHPNMAIFALTGVLLIVYQIGWRRATLAALAAYAVGGLIGVAPFVAWVAYAHAHYGVSFYEQLGAWYTAVGVDEPLAVVRREIARWWGYLRLPHRAPWVLVLTIGLVAGVVRRRPLDVWGWLLIAGHALLLPLLNRMGSPRYLVVLSPWLAAPVGLLAIDLWNRAKSGSAGATPGRIWRALAVGCVALTAAVHVAATGYTFYIYRNADYDVVCRRIAQHIPPGERVWGNLVFWVGLHQYPYVSEINEEHLAATDVARILQARLQAFQPTYGVRCSDLCWRLDGSRPRRTTPHREIDRTSGEYPRWEALENRFKDAYYPAHGTLLDRFTTADFGTIEVYRLRP